MKKCLSSFGRSAIWDRRACNLWASQWIKPDKVAQFAKELDLNYPALIGGYDTVDLSKPLGNGLAALPFTVILDRDGHVAHAQMGPLKPTQLRSILGNLI